MVRDDSNYADGSGDYRLYFAHIPGNYSIPTGDEGGALTNVSVHTGTIELGDMDLWTFHADALDTVDAQVDEVVTTGLKPQLLLFGPDGSLITSQEGADSAQISHQATVAGTYTLMVRDITQGTASGSGNYSLTFNLTPDITQIPPGLIITGLQNGGHVQGAFETVDDVDKYSLSVNSGDKVHLQVGESESDGNLSPVVQIFSSNGSLIAEARHGQVARVVFKAELTETLTVVVFNDVPRLSANNYDLYTAIAPQDFTIPAGDQGGVLVNGMAASGSWLPRGDMDLYTLAVNAGDKVRLQLGKPDVNAAISPRLKVFSSNGSLIAESGHNQVARVAFTAETTETLTVLTLNDGSEKDVDDYRLYTAIVPRGFFTPAGDDGGGTD
jgi:hypothetical protein